ncbi:Scr1 family TA system antitoxin-like transcriptional regulator [Streptomyces sp. 061-3]|uniref:Scr1 family TA system antitoxin-like transcriptional regulator n=1 Tax=Streptomyces sp. 061-3 TaxID=2789268 RepID=UPI00397EEF18
MPATLTGSPTTSAVGQVYGVSPYARSEAVTALRPIAALRGSPEVDSTHGPEFLYGEAQLAKYRSHLDRMERIALPPEKSRDFIHDIARHL